MIILETIGGKEIARVSEDSFPLKVRTEQEVLNTEYRLWLNFTHVNLDERKNVKLVRSMNVAKT